MIEISHVRKSFGKKEVLRDISLTIQENQIYGLIGYNGVGKTTLLKLMNGVYRQDAGSILVDGKEIFEDANKKCQIFLMTEELFLLPQANLLEMESFCRGYYPKWDTEAYHRMADLFGLDKEQRIGGFSKGMQRQAGLMTAFSSGCRYLFLDEAFDGLDLGIRLVMRKVLRRYVERREATVILTSHNLGELEECADRFGMIRDGKITADQAVKEVTRTGMHLEEFFLKKQGDRGYELDGLFGGSRKTSNCIS